MGHAVCLLLPVLPAAHLSSRTQQAPVKLAKPRGVPIAACLQLPSEGTAPLKLGTQHRNPGQVFR